MKQQFNQRQGRARRPSVDLAIEQLSQTYDSVVDRSKLQDLVDKYQKYDQPGKVLNKTELKDLMIESGLDMKDERISNIFEDLIQKRSTKKQLDIKAILEIYAEIMKQSDEDEYSNLEYIDAFVFLGGGADKEGHVSVSRILETFTQEFEMENGAKEIVEDMLKDLGNAKELTFQEFVQIFEQSIDDNKSRASFISALSQKAQQSGQRNRSGSFNVRFKDFEKWEEDQERRRRDNNSRPNQ